MVSHIVQFLVHVPDCVEVNARGYQRDHAKHTHGQRVDVITNRQSQFAERPQGVPYAGEGPGCSVMNVVAVFGVAVGSRMALTAHSIIDAVTNLRVVRWNRDPNTKCDKGKNQR